MPLPVGCKVPAEKLADSIMGVLLYVTSCFFLAAFNILSLSLIFTVLFIMYLSVDLSDLILFGMFLFTGSGFLVLF